jgi:hypothetical protein
VLVVLHAADGFHFVDAKGLVGEGVEEEYFFTRTKNNYLQVQVVKQAVHINANDSLD